MSVYRLVHLPSGKAVATVERAESWWAKGWGVLGRHTIPAGEGLWLPGVASVHTVGVRFSLDLLFLDKDFRTVKTVLGTPPGLWLIRASGACHVVELGPGTLKSPWNVLDKWRLERLTAERCFSETEAARSLFGGTETE